MGHSTLIAGTAAAAAGALAGLCTDKICRYFGMGEDEKGAMKSFVGGFVGVATGYTINTLLADPVGAGVTTAAAVGGGIAGSAVKTS